MEYQKERMQAQKERLQQSYPVGTRVELSSLCNDEAGMPYGLRGTVVGIDDQPALLMEWDNGRALSLLPGEDSFRKLTEAEIEAEKHEAIVSEDAPGPVMG